MARNILAGAIAESTRKGYRSAIRSLATFCEANHLTLTFPVSADTICLWMAGNSSTLTFQSMRVYLHGIANAHVEAGYRNPLTDNGQVWRMLAGVKRLQGQRVTRKRLPITTELLSELETFQDMSTHDGRLIRAAMWLGTCGLLRSGEFAKKDKDSVVLRRSHLTFHTEAGAECPRDSPQVDYMKLFLPKSKTDPFCAGAQVVISNKNAISAMLTYLTTKFEPITDQPLLRTSCGTPLTVSELVRGTRHVLKQAGAIDAELYLGHSFRRGGATSLHLAGQPDSVIKAMGRWRSFAFARYVDTPTRLLVAAGRAMSASSSQGRSVTFALRQSTSWTNPIWDFPGSSDSLP